MKQTKFLTMSSLAAGIIFFSSCNSGKDKKTDANTSDSTATRRIRNFLSHNHLLS
jgi:hypothetical protein